VAFQATGLSGWLCVVHRNNDSGPPAAGGYSRRPQKGQNAYSAGESFLQKRQVFAAAVAGAVSATDISQRSQVSIGSPVFTRNTGMKKTLR
jgi:hypothetical protein